MPYKQYYAHSLQGKPPSHWQPLIDHLKNTATLAGRFAAVFGASDWAKSQGSGTTLENTQLNIRGVYMPKNLNPRSQNQIIHPLGLNTPPHNLGILGNSWHIRLPDTTPGCLTAGLPTQASSRA